MKKTQIFNEKNEIVSNIIYINGNVTLVMLKWFKNGENPIENRGER